jgi:hypothetical protein
MTPLRRRVPNPSSTSGHSRQTIQSVRYGRGTPPAHGVSHNQVFVQVDCSLGHLLWQFMQIHIEGSSVVNVGSVPLVAAVLIEDVMRRLALER